MLACLLACLLLLGACGASQGIRPAAAAGGDRAAALLVRADAATGDDAASLRLSAAELLLADERPAEASGLLESIAANTPELRTRLGLLRAKLSLAADDAVAAMANLRGVAPPDRASDQFVAYHWLLGDIHAAMANPRQAVSAWVEASTSLDDSRGSELQRNIWNALTRLSNRNLEEMAASATSYELRGWIELARVVDPGQHDIPRQLRSLASWQRAWEQHSAARELPEQLARLENAWAERPSHIALILPLREAAGAALQQGFLAGYYEALAESRQVPYLSLFDSSAVTDIAPLLESAEAAGADLIVGPLFKERVNELLDAGELPLPTLALNYTDSEPPPGNNDLFQFALAPEDEIDAVIELAWQDGHRSAAVIHPANDVFTRLRDIFAENWQARGGAFAASTGYRDNGDFTAVVKIALDIHASEERFARLLDVLPRSSVQFTPRRRQDLDFIFLMANPQAGRQIKPALNFYYAEELPVFALPSIHDGVDNPGLNRDLDGIVFADAPLMWQMDENANFTTGGAERRLQAMGLDSFRLYPWLQQLQRQFQQNRTMSLRGATGELRMEAGQRIRRQLAPGRFANGVARPLAEPGG